MLVEDPDGPVLMVRTPQPMDPTLVAILNDLLRPLTHPVDYQRRSLSSREAAAMVGCSPKTIVRRAHEGKIPYRENGRRLQFELEDIEDYIRSIRRDKLI